MARTIKNPDAPAKAWDENAGRMLMADEKTGEFEVKFAVGDGKIEFGIRTVAVIGSLLCGERPDVRFTFMDTADYATASARPAFPNPVNAIVDLITPDRAATP